MAKSAVVKLSVKGGGAIAYMGPGHANAKRRGRAKRSNSITKLSGSRRAKGDHGKPIL